MRKVLAVLGVMVAISLQATTPELGKDQLRKLLKLPTLNFQPSWNFEAESGFTLGSSEHEATNKFSELVKSLKNDNSDAEIYLQLAELHQSFHHAANARAAFSRAADLFRERVDSQPSDARLLADFGCALEGAEKHAEAESVLRKALRLTPKEPRCWLALGRYLDSAAGRSLAGGAESADNNSNSGKLSSAQVSESKRLLDESDTCFDRAVTLAPAESESWFRRAMHRSLRSMMLNEIRLSSGEQKDDLDLFSDYFSAAALADLKRASRLDSKNYRLIGTVVLYEIYNACAHKGQVAWRDFSWNSLPDKSQLYIRESLTRLQNLGESPDPRISAGALEVLGILEGPVLHESRASSADLRRAVALDPSRDQAWELLASSLAQSQNYNDLLALADLRLRQADSTRNRILLAKAYEKLKRWDDAEEEIDMAIKDSPDDFVLNLGLGALLLKRSQEDPSLLDDADGWLAHAQEILKKMPSSERTRQQIVDLTLTRSIYYALTDEVETARLWAKSVLEQDKSNKMAQEILSAMDY